MTFEEIIKENNSLIWAIVNNTNRRFYSHNFQKYLYSKFDKEDLYQELLTKIHKEYSSFNSMLNVKMTTFMTTVCVNHLSTLMQPYGAKKNQLKVITNIDLNRFEDTTQNENTLYNELTIQEAIASLSSHRHCDILTRLLKGKIQSDVARDMGISRQRVNKIWKDYLLSIEEAE